MDTQQLKLLAGRLCGVLEQNNFHIKHGQALDLIAAIPGLRNWPEVISFPDRVADAELTELSTARLSLRMADTVGVTLEPSRLLADLSAPSYKPAFTTTVWPTGPVPGIYVTTSQTAIEAAIRRYEHDTEGALMYGERAGNSADSAIDLGEQGIFSNGLLRAPSGTLIVLGPVEMTQESWGDNCDRLRVASHLVNEAGLRVAILFETPMPQTLRSDVALLVQWEHSEPGEVDEALRGIVTDDGKLEAIFPFVEPRPAPVSALTPKSTAQFPSDLAQVLEEAITIMPFGLVVVGSSVAKEPRCAMLEAVLPFTEHAGPAARIQPNFRGGYGGDDEPLSSRFEGLPVCPSIESAYASGYRRMVIESPYGNAADSMFRHASDVCFLVAAYSAEVAGAFLNAVTNLRRQDEAEALNKIIAILCVAEISTKRRKLKVCDAFITSKTDVPKDNVERLFKYVEEHRVL